MLAVVPRSDLVTTGEAARALGVSTTTIHDWVKAGVITPASRTAGGHYRWNLDELRRQVDEHLQGRSPEA